MPGAPWAPASPPAGAPSQERALAQQCCCARGCRVPQEGRGAAPAGKLEERGCGRLEHGHTPCKVSVQLLVLLALVWAVCCRDCFAGITLHCAAVRCGVLGWQEPCSHLELLCPTAPGPAAHLGDMVALSQCHQVCMARGLCPFCSSGSRYRWNLGFLHGCCSFDQLSHGLRMDTTTCRSFSLILLKEAKQKSDITVL